MILLTSTPSSRANKRVEGEACALPVEVVSIMTAGAATGAGVGADGAGALTTGSGAFSTTGSTLGASATTGAGAAGALPASLTNTVAIRVPSETLSPGLINTS